MRIILTIVLFFASASWVVMAQNAGSPPASPGSAALDYEFFKAKVQPIFLAKRPGHARCVACHASRPRAMCRVPCVGYADAAAAALPGNHHLERRRIPKELRRGQA